MNGVSENGCAFFVPVSTKQTIGKRQYVDLEVLVGYVRTGGIKAALFEVPCGRDHECTLREILQHGMPIAIFWHLPDRTAFDLMKSVDNRVIPGGLFQAAIGRFPSIRDAETLSSLSALACVIRGDPELTVMDILHCLLRKNDWQNQKGITRRTNGTFVRMPPRELLEDLDSLPQAVDDLFNEERLIHGQEVLCSRGCDNACAYCTLHIPYRAEFPKVDAFWRSRSAVRIVDEIESYYTRKGARSFKLNSFVFFGSGKTGSNFASDVASEIVRRKLHISFSIVADAGAVRRNEHLFPLLKNAGLSLVRLGLDSPVRRMLKLYHVPFSVDDQEQALEILCSSQVNFIPSMIFYDPYSTIQELDYFLAKLLTWQKYFVHLEAPYWYVVGRFILSTFLHVQPEFPIATTLHDAGLDSSEKGDLLPFTFADAQTAMVYKLHKPIFERYVIPIIEDRVKQGLPVHDPQLNAFPVQALRQVIYCVRSCPEWNDLEICLRVRTWAEQYWKDSSMMGLNHSWS